MILYYNKGSDMIEKIINPIPKTVKLLMKVKLFRRLLSLSLYNIYIYTALSRASKCWN